MYTYSLIAYRHNSTFKIEAIMCLISRYGGRNRSMSRRGLEIAFRQTNYMFVLVYGFFVFIHYLVSINQIILNPYNMFGVAGTINAKMIIPLLKANQILA